MGWGIRLRHQLVLLIHFSVTTVLVLDEMVEEVSRRTGAEKEYK